MLRPAPRRLAWLGSAGLHAVAGAGLLLGVPDRPASPVPVTLLEMAAEPVRPAPPPEPPPDAALAEAAPQPPPREPAEEALPDAPPVAEAPPAAPPEPGPPEPVPDLSEPPAELASLPPPPPPAPVPAPRRPAPPRPAVARAEAAPVVAAPAPAPPPPAAPAVAPAAPPPSYVALLFAALERHKAYPQEARSRRAQGVAMLRVRMRRDGTVMGYRIERSTGDAALDEAVAGMIRRASPLPAPPPELAGDPIELTVPVRFALR